MRTVIVIAGFVAVFAGGYMTRSIWGDSAQPAAQPDLYQEVDNVPPNRVSPPPAIPPSLPPRKTFQQFKAPSPSAPLQADTMPGIFFTPAKIDLGTMIEGEAKSLWVEIKRPANTPLKLGRLHSTCPCVKVTSQQQLWIKNEKAYVKVSIHSLGRMGHVKVPISVEVKEPQVGILTADVHAVVLRWAAKLRISPASFLMGNIQGSTKQTIKLYNLSKRPLTVKALTCSVQDAQVKSLDGQIILPGESARIELTLPASLAPGAIRGAVTIQTDLPEHFSLKIPLSGVKR